MYCGGQGRYSVPIVPAPKGCLILLGKRRFGTGFKLDNLTTKKLGLNINETPAGKVFEAFV
jgi:hypothetical protein